MTDGPSDDRDLRSDFERLRELEHARAPDANAVLARARAEAERLAAARDRRDRRRRLHLGWPGLTVALAAGLAALILLQPGDDGAEFDQVVEAWVATSGSWRSPTDDLLRMPGDEILRTMPRIGGMRPITLREPTSSPDEPRRESPS